MNTCNTVQPGSGEGEHLCTLVRKREGNLLWRVLGPGSDPAPSRSVGRLARLDRLSPDASSSEGSPLPLPMPKG